MRSRSPQLSMSLFPFLAVLVCAMGALIFLLLIITRMIREDVLASETKSSVEPIAVTETVEPAPVAPAPVIVETEKEPEPQIVLPSLVAELSFPSVDLSDLETRVAQLKQTVIESNANLATNAGQLEEMAAKIQAQNQLVEARQRELEAMRRRQISQEQNAASLSEIGEQTRQNLKVAQGELAALGDQRTKLEEQRQALMANLAASTEQLAQTQAQAEKIEAALQEKEEALKSAMDGYQIIPVDSKTGTSRYPILIECTKDGLEFRPEGLTLGPVEMKGFTTGFNPLLAGAKALMQYWEGQEQARGQKAYVLMIVRPSGIESFYAARKYLQGLENELGYELISNDVPLAIPPLNQGAKEALEKAVAQALAARNQLAERVLSGPGRGFPELMSQAATDPAFGGRGGGNPGGENSETMSPVGQQGVTGGVEEKGGRGNSATQFEADPNARNYDPARGQAANDDNRENNTNTTSLSQNSSGQRGGSPPSESMSSSAPSSPMIRPGATASGTPSWEEVAKEAGASEGSSDAAPENIARMLAKTGMTNRAGQIGIEKRITVYLDADQMQFNDTRPISLVNLQSSDQFKQIFWGMVEQEVARWKSPPNGFYWTPQIKFFVSPGGNRHYTRIDSALKTLRIPVTVEQTLEPRSTVASPDLESSFK